MNTETTRAELPYRCAVYFAPTTDTDEWQLGSQWLGRCAATGQTLPQPDIAGVEKSTLMACTAEPRRYGWHATLKAPFSLAPDQDMASTIQALRRLADTLPSFTLPPLRVSTLGQFLALRPEGDMQKIQSLAAACVKQLHHLALPLSDAQLARRRQTALSPSQDLMLHTWGYPWVLDHFRFHLSLTGPLDKLPLEVRVALIEAAQRRFHALPAWHFEHIALFVEPHPGADFELVEHMELRG